MFYQIIAADAASADHHRGLHGPDMVSAAVLEGLPSRGLARLSLHPQSELENTESLTLILAACVVCMGLGVPIGIAAAHRPHSYQAMVPVLDLMQTLPTLRVL